MVEHVQSNHKFKLSVFQPNDPKNFIKFVRLDGKVCVSLLGTWSGKGTETWTPNSNLLQLLVSIQGLILVREPYFNEAGYEKQKGTQQGEENSRMYNEMAVLKLVTSMTRMVNNPPKPFVTEITDHMKDNAGKLITRLM